MLPKKNLRGALSWIEEGRAPPPPDYYQEGKTIDGLCNRERGAWMTNRLPMYDLCGLFDCLGNVGAVDLRIPDEGC